MAHLDLEEQEQLDQLKHFWRQYGNPITWVLIAVLAAVAGWNLYQYWQRSQASQAAAMYDEVERIAVTGDVAKLERALGDMKEKFASTTYAQQAGLLAAKVYVDAGKLDAAKGALLWVADKSSDEGYQAIARLRLAGVLIESKAYDEALKQLAGNFPADFAFLADDRRGDVYLAQGKKTEAVAEYLKAYKGLDASSEYRRLIDVKLAALGASVQAERAAGGAK
ncbi:YfgM family protein [Curvibacter delicatus]|jgi:predicted negative regulator of RcsB-dependent stress response|uniref:YfgM family protein n=1 Tax=Curvibacter delicatus TaxID=80879 RepID=UPI000830176E|nr:tetratricopeptide repeat protein [Curvibacter delicatus]